MADTLLLEKQVHHPGATLVMEFLELLDHRVGAAHEAQPGRRPDHVALGTAGNHVAQIELLAGTSSLDRLLYRGGHPQPAPALRASQTVQPLLGLLVRLRQVDAAPVHPLVRLRLPSGLLAPLVVLAGDLRHLFHRYE